MKNIKKLLVGVLCLTLVFTLTGCTDKKSITAEEFKSQMESAGYEVQDATNQFSNYSQVQKVYIAVNSNYQIEFYQIDTVDNAVAFYNNNKSIFEQSKSSNSTYSSKEIKNFAKYALNTSGNYKVLSRIDNTVILLNVNSSYKNEINSILDKLGY